MLNSTTQFDCFAGPELESVVYTTKAQAEIWNACYFGGKDAARAFNESISLEFTGLLDISAMDQSIQTLMERHEALRATFSTDGIYMSIYKQIRIELTTIDLSDRDEIGKQQAVDQYTNKDAHYLFDLVDGPLIKFGVLKLSEINYIVVITVHHIICDDWSIGIMLQDLGIIYSAYVEKKIPKLSTPIPFSTYANEKLSFCKSDENKETEKFWYEIYKSSIPIVNLPTDNPRPSVRTYKSQRLDFELDSVLISNLKQTGLSVGASLVTTLLTTFELFLYQLTGQDDLVVGLPSAGQAATGMNHLIGHCVNLLPLRSKPMPSTSFKDFLKQRKSELFDGYDHSQLSFGQLLQKLNIARDPSRIPLVPVVFNIDLGMTDGVHFSNLTYKLISNPKAFETFEISLNASGTEKNLVFEWSYNETLFKPETINKMMVSFEEIIKKVVTDSSKTIGQITFQDFTSDYNELNATSANYPAIALHDLFDIQVDKTPNKIALEFHDQTITYKSLQEQVYKLAHYFKEQGISSGDLIAISLPRSAELVISLLAIMHCGAAYLPLDHEYPNERLNFMIDDSEAKFLLTSKTLSPSLPKHLNTILIENAREFSKQYPATKQETLVAPNEMVYLMYTSGSTGNPKGVPITHKNLVNLLCSMSILPGIEETDRLLSITTISFDIAGLELYLPIINGATLIIANSETARDPRLLLELMQNKNISYLQATPTTWQMLINSEWSKPLKIKALCGGEALSIDLAKKLIEKCDSLWNVYGPTETTIWSSLKRIKKDDSFITIGKPIANTQLYIIDEDGNLLAPGNIGEIAIGGDGLAKGYWKRQELTDEKFIIKEFPDSTIKTIYRTGDLGKLLDHNEIVCLGRVDQQVKIRGHRIEPGEVEQVLLTFEGVQSVVVLANENHLIAHIVPLSKIETAKELIPLWRKKLSSKLPSHLVPHSFNLLEAFPTTLNGKIDRKALSEYKTIFNEDNEFTATRTESEKLVSDIWKECLNLDQIDIFSNFFEIGGNSLIAVKVMSKIEKETGERLPLASLFEYSTIEKLALLLKEDKKTTSDYLIPLKPNGSKTPLFLVHGAGLNILNFAHLIHHFDEDQPVYGFQGIGPDGFENWFESIEDMAATYIDSMIKTNPNGPYAVVGFSFGGVVAFEIARQLKEQGKNISIIGLLDTNLDSSYYYSSYSQKKLIRYCNRMHKWFHFSLEMLTSWKLLKLHVYSKKKYLLKKYFGLKDIIIEQEVVALEKFTEANSMVNKIVDRYQIIPQHLEVDLFRAEDDDTYRVDPTHLGWKKAALDGVNIHNISGNHLDIVSPPNDKILARMLQGILDKKDLSFLIYYSVSELLFS